MKNKKRTLIILLVLIIVLIVILGIIVLFGGMKDREIKEFYQTVEEITCEYAEGENINEPLCNAFSNLCHVNYDTLISWGYLDENLVNPKTGERVSEDNTSYVEITWEDNKMICTFKEG